MWAARKKASGAVEVESKAIVAVAAEQRGRGIGRIRLRRVKDVSAESLLAFLQEAVEPGAKIHTDGWRGYAGLPAAGYRHQVTVISGGSEPAHEVMKRVHKVAALLKRSLSGFSRAASSTNISTTTSMNSVRPDGARHQWRKVPPRELSVDLVADERPVWATRRVEAS